jgi:glycosyltransferase involved in cell wall biosynthesis
MSAPERSVLHVLPHHGGGGETYVDLLEAMPGYRFSRVYLTPSAQSSARVVPGMLRALRQGRRHDLVHVHGEVASGLCLPLLATRPSLVTLNGLHFLRRMHGASRRLAVLNLHALVRAADYTICVSYAERDYLIAAVGPSAAQRVVVVHNGVDISLASSTAGDDVRGELGVSGSEPLGIWVGGLDHHKDPLTAVRGAVKSSVPLLVVGDGPLRRPVEEAANEWVRVLGRRRDVLRLLAASDFFVLTSRREGLSFALLEAMSYGLPAVVTDLAENVEAVGDSGYVVPEGDEDALAEALRRLADNAEERAAMGRRARDRVSARFDAVLMVRRTRALYDQLLADRGEVYEPAPIGSIDDGQSRP